MKSETVRGLLLSVLIGAAMAAGIMLTAPHAKATPEQDYTYYSLLESNGLTVLSPSNAKLTATAICNELAAGNSWRVILTELMNLGDWTLDDATTVFAAAVIAYCPELKPDFGRQIT